MGARGGMVAPDEVTIEYIKGREHAPKGADWDKAVVDEAVIIFCHDIRFRSKAKSSNKPGEFKTPPGDILPKTMF